MVGHGVGVQYTFMDARRHVMGADIPFMGRQCVDDALQHFFPLKSVKQLKVHCF